MYIKFDITKYNFVIKLRSGFLYVLISTFVQGHRAREKAIEQETRLSKAFRLTGNSVCNDYYSKDSHGRLYHTEQDEVTEVTTEKDLEDRLSSCITYTEDFLREFSAKRALRFL